MKVIFFKCMVLLAARAAGFLRQAATFFSAREADGALYAPPKPPGFVDLSENPEMAVEKYTAVLKKEPANVMALLRRGWACDMLGKYAEAEADYSAVIRIDPKNADAYEGLAWMYAGEEWGELLKTLYPPPAQAPGVHTAAMAKEHEAAVAAFAQMARLRVANEPDKKAAAVKLAEEGYYFEEFKADCVRDDRAAGCWRVVTELDPRDAEAWYRLSGLCVNPDSIAALRKAVELDPGNLRYHEALVYAYRGMGDSAGEAKALEAWLKAAGPDPANVQSLRELVDEYKSTGDFEGEVKARTAIIAAKPDPDSYLSREALYEEHGENALAEADYNTALALAPKDFGLLEVRANFFERERKWKEAEQDYDAAIRVATTRIEPRGDERSGYQSRGEFYVRIGRFGDAAADYRSALAYEPGNCECFGGLGDAYYGEGKWDKALADYNAMLRSSMKQAADEADKITVAYDCLGATQAHRPGEYAEALPRTLSGQKMTGGPRRRGCWPHAPMQNTATPQRRSS